MSGFFSNFVGSFADAAILFPLLWLMGQKTGFQFQMLFLSAGLLVILSGWYFKVPMAVQPLKSIAIAALAVGATAPEIQMSTFILSLIFIGFLFFKTEKFKLYFPESWIHALQLSLGLLLIRQGYESIAQSNSAILMLLSGALIYFIQKWKWPVLGILATLALCSVFIFGARDFEIQKKVFEFKFGIPLSDMRWPLVLNLVLPQIILTMANSVIATENTCRYYFGGESNHQLSDQTAQTVTTFRLIKSIAASNFFSSLLGGLPMCHGSGGVTALYKGGARHWTSNLYLGFFLLGLAALTFFYDVRSLVFPQLIFATLLVVVGVYHLVLAQSTWISTEGKIRLLLAATVVLTTRNLILVLAAQVILSFLQLGFVRAQKRMNQQ